MNVYYTPAEVAERLKLNMHTVLKYIRQGRLPASRLGNRYRISEEQLQDFMVRASTIHPPPDGREKAQEG